MLSRAKFKKAQSSSWFYKKDNSLKDSKADNEQEKLDTDHGAAQTQKE